MLPCWLNILGFADAGVLGGGQTSLGQRLAGQVLQHHGTQHHTVSASSRCRAHMLLQAVRPPGSNRAQAMRGALNCWALPVACPPPDSRK